MVQISSNSRGIISNHETGSAQAIGADFASFQILGPSEAALNCEDADICLQKMTENSIPAEVSFEFE